MICIGLAVQCSSSLGLGLSLDESFSALKALSGASGVGFSTSAWQHIRERGNT